MSSILPILAIVCVAAAPLSGACKGRINGSFEDVYYVELYDPDIANPDDQTIGYITVDRNKNETWSMFYTARPFSKRPITKKDRDACLGVSLPPPPPLSQTRGAAGEGATFLAPQPVAAADLNADGLSDIVQADSARNFISIWLATAGGRLPSNPVNITVGAAPTSVAVGDFNGDGRPDLAIALYGAPFQGNNGGLAILLANGDGTFRAPVSYSAGVGPSSVEAADLDGDGRLDLAVASRGGPQNTVGRVGILLGNADGTFRAATLIAAGDSPERVLAVDLDGDSRLDLAVSNAGANAVSILLATGGGQFRAPVAIPLGTRTDFLAAGDLNGDSRPDLVVGLPNAGALVALINRGAGAFQAGDRFLGGLRPESLSLADLDGDGDLDILVAPQFRNRLLAILGRGDGTFSAPKLHTIPPGARSIAAADFNGDGRPDTAVAVGTPGVAVSLGRDGNTFADPVLVPIRQGAAGTSASAVAAADFNQDSRVDLAVADADGGVAVMAGNGAGGFQIGSRTAAGPSPIAIVARDFNGDGRMDLAIANNGTSQDLNSGNISVLLGAAGGTFQAAVNYRAGVRPGAIASGDFNGDGRPDLAVANGGQGFPRTNGNVSVLLATGAGVFAAAVNYPAGSNPVAVAVADFNGDGRADLAVTTALPREGDSGVAVLIGVGDGTFRPAVILPDDFGAGALAAVDVNGDGRQDLVIAHCCGSTAMSLRRGVGDGTFQAAEPFLAALEPMALAVADFNSDGRPDLAVAGGSREGSLVFLRNSPPPALVNVSAASFEGGALAPDSIVAAFGQRLATTTAGADGPGLPETIAGTTVRVADSEGAERAARLFFVSPGQVNYLVPAGTATGAARVTVVSGDGTVSVAGAGVDTVAPAFFTLNGDGLAAANVLRVRASGDQIVEPVFDVEPGTNRVVARPIDLGPAGERVFLLLYGTGIRGRDAAAPIRMNIAGFVATAAYAGAQGDFAGLDQVNVQISPALRGRGVVDIVFQIDGVPANTVRVRIQ